MKKSSRIKEFYKKGRDERISAVKDFANLTYSDTNYLEKTQGLNSFIEKMSENVVSAFSLPYSVAPNFLINGRDFLIPMVTEETSVVAGASKAAKLCRSAGGFKACVDRSLMIGQIHLVNVSDIQSAKYSIEMHKSELIEIANKKDPTLVELGGGASDISFRQISGFSLGEVLVVHLFVNVKDAMGANIVNTMVEAIAPELEKLTKADALMSIVSNMSIHRIAKATAVWNVNELGADLIEKIILAGELAKIDIFRAVTHNKGIMNGIDAVAIATGNDFRAIEAGAHGFACYEGTYKPLTTYGKDSSGNLVGKIELPIAVGIVGGATKVNTLAQISLKILSVKSAEDLAEIMASVGLAQNFAAIHAIVKNGIQHGHMKLHSRNIAINAGLPEEFIDLVSEKMVANGTISIADAKKILGSIKNGITWK